MRIVRRRAIFSRAFDPSVCQQVALTLARSSGPLLAQEVHDRLAKRFEVHRAVSSDHCESAGVLLEPSLHESGWGAVVEAGAGPVVQFGGRCPDLVIAVLVEVGSFGEVLAQ